MRLDLHLYISAKPMISKRPSNQHVILSFDIIMLIGVARKMVPQLVSRMMEVKNSSFPSPNLPPFRSPPPPPFLDLLFAKKSWGIVTGSMLFASA